MAKNKKIKVEGKEITIVLEKEQEYISLTDMLKAKDGDFLIPIGFETEIPWILEFGKVFYNPDFNYGGFATIRTQAGLNSYKISVKE